MNRHVPPTPRSIWRSPSGHLWPLVDAVAAIFATVIEADVLCALAANGQGNPCACAILQAFKRAAGAPDGMVSVDKSYIVLKRGETYLAHRFQTPLATRRAIERFDRLGEMPEGALELIPVSKTEGLDAQRAADKRMRTRWATVGHVPTPTLRREGRNAASLATTMVLKRHESD